MSTKEELEKKATQVVDTLITDLTSRRGLRRVWDQIDPDWRETIRETWIRKTAGVLASGA